MFNTKYDVFTKPNQVIVVPKANQIFVSWYVYYLPITKLYFESLTECNILFLVAVLTAEPFISKTDTGGVGRASQLRPLDKLLYFTSSE